MTDTLKALATKTKDIYERRAQQFDAERAKVLFEKSWLKRFQNLLPPGGAILDVGCGSGEPIAHYFIDEGFALIGIDFSTAMIDMAKVRFPLHHWRVADMRTLDLGKRYDGIIGWHSFFHLTQDEQRACLVRLAEHLKTPGVLMLTIGPEAGEVTGHVGGEEVYHASLSIDEYTDILTRAGLDLVRFTPDDPECDGASVLLAKK